MDDRTQAILAQFAESWIETEHELENLINNYGWEQLKPVLLFISNLKQNDGHCFFRLGTGLGFPIPRVYISRAVNHGLRFEQKYIMIEPNDHTFDVTLREGGKKYRQYTLTDLNDIRLSNLLKTLKHTLVD